MFKKLGLNLWKKKAILLFLVVLFALFPSAASRPPQMLSKVILTEITIDRSGEEYTLSGEMVQIGGNNTDIAASAGTVGDCINKISEVQGKQVSFAHCKNIVLKEGLKDEPIDDILQYFLYKTELSNTCALSWEQKGKRTTLDQFFKDTFKGSDFTMLSKGVNEISIFKSGVHVFDLDEVQTDTFNLLRGAKIKKRLVDKTNVLSVTSNTSKIKRHGDNVNINIKIKAKLESNPFAGKQEILRITKDIETKIKNDIESLISAVYPDTDLLNLGTVTPLLNTTVDIIIMA